MSSRGRAAACSARRVASAGPPGAPPGHGATAERCAGGASAGCCLGGRGGLGEAGRAGAGRVGEGAEGRGGANPGAPPSAGASLGTPARKRWSCATCGFADNFAERAACWMCAAEPLQGRRDCGASGGGSTGGPSAAAAPLPIPPPPSSRDGGSGRGCGGRGRCRSRAGAVRPGLLVGRARGLGERRGGGGGGRGKAPLPPSPCGGRHHLRHSRGRRRLARCCLAIPWSRLDALTIHGLWPRSIGLVLLHVD